MNTREKILWEALDLFSTRGYDSVSVRDIARAVGIKESSLYNHFKNKQDIFDTIISECSSRGNQFFHQMQLLGEQMQFAVDDRTVDMYRNMSDEQFAAVAGRIFEYYFADEQNVKLRRMLTIEQYRNPEIAKLYRDISFDDAINFQSELFASLMAAGCFVGTDPYLLAIAFFAPVFLIFCKYDNNERSLAEARALFDRHVKHFNQTYNVHDTTKATGEGEQS